MNAQCVFESILKCFRDPSKVCLNCNYVIYTPVIYLEQLRNDVIKLLNQHCIINNKDFNFTWSDGSQTCIKRTHLGQRKNGL